MENVFASLHTYEEFRCPLKLLLASAPTFSGENHGFPHNLLTLWLLTTVTLTDWVAHSNAVGISQYLNSASSQVLSRSSSKPGTFGSKTPLCKIWVAVFLAELRKLSAAKQHRRAPYCSACQIRRRDHCPHASVHTSQIIAVPARGFN